MVVKATGWLLIDATDIVCVVKFLLCVFLCPRLAPPSSSSSLYGAGMPINKRLQSCGPPSPAGIPHRSGYLAGLPGRDQPPVARYGLQMASVPSSFDPVAAAAAAFHAQSHPPVSTLFSSQYHSFIYSFIVFIVTSVKTHTKLQ